MRRCDDCGRWIWPWQPWDGFGPAGMRLRQADRAWHSRHTRERAEQRHAGPHARTSVCQLLGCPEPDELSEVAGVIGDGYDFCDDCQVRARADLRPFPHHADCPIGPGVPPICVCGHEASAHQPAEGYVVCTGCIRDGGNAAHRYELRRPAAAR